MSVTEASRAATAGHSRSASAAPFNVITRPSRLMVTIPLTRESRTWSV